MFFITTTCLRKKQAKLFSS